MRPILFALVTAACLQAQWIHQPTLGIPRTADGKLNLTAPAPRAADGKPDLSGLWTLAGAGAGIKQQLKPEEIQPWAQKLSQEREENLGSDGAAILCLPSGFLGFGLAKIVQTPTLIVMLAEDLTYRQIFLDGRELPKDPNPAWMGYSVGRWDGDTLVVESTGYNDRTWIDNGYPHSEQMRMTERYRRTDFGHLAVDIIMSDPAIYAKPIRSTMNGLYTPDTEMIEYVCAENEKDHTHLVGRKSDDAKRAVKVPAELLSKYVGAYMVRTKDLGFPGPEFIPFNMALENGELVLVIAGLGRQPMTALSETRFANDAIGVVEFAKNDKGEVTHIVIETAGGEFSANRRPPPVPRVTLFDRNGKAVTRLGEPQIDAQPALSPDGSKVAVVKRAPGGDGQVWIYTLGTAQSARITENGPARSSPVWSPDGSEIAYVTNGAVYRKAADGTGAETLVYKPAPGPIMFLTNWSPDGRICLWSGDSLYLVPVRGDGKPLILPKARGGSLSPDGRYLAYNSNESGQWAVYIQDLAGDAAPLRATKDPSVGGVFWRKDGKELFYLSVGGAPSVMSVEIGTSPALEVKPPTRLFPLPGGIPGPAQLTNVASSDGQHFVFPVIAADDGGR